jgi:hypothetical protein
MIKLKRDILIKPLMISHNSEKSWILGVGIWSTDAILSLKWLQSVWDSIEILSVKCLMEANINLLQLAITMTLTFWRFMGNLDMQVYLLGWELDKSSPCKFLRAICFYKQENNFSIWLEATLTVAITKSFILKRFYNKNKKPKKKERFHGEYHQLYFPI